MPRSNSFEVSGTVVEVLPSGMFRVKLPNGHVALALTDKKKRDDFRSVLPGQMVLLDMSPYDLTKGRVTRLEVDHQT